MCFLYDTYKHIWLYREKGLCQYADCRQRVRACQFRMILIHLQYKRTMVSLYRGHTAALPEKEEAREGTRRLTTTPWAAITKVVQVVLCPRRRDPSDGKEMV